MRRTAWLCLVACVLVCRPAHPTPPETSPEIYVANREYPAAPLITVAVLPFATGDHPARWGQTLAKHARRRFARLKFHVLTQKTVDALTGEETSSTARLLPDNALIEIGRTLDADWVVHGRLMDLDTSRSEALGIPLPTGKQAACVIETVVVDMTDEQSIFRRWREARGEVGSEWFTTDGEARATILGRCMRYLYDPLLERIPRGNRDPYQRRPYVSQDIDIEPEETKVAICRFVDYGGGASREAVVTEETRKAFARSGFRLVSPGKLEHACAQLPHDLREAHDDETLSKLARSLGADVLVFGEIAQMNVHTKHVPLVKFSVPLPGRKQASCVLRTKVVDARTQQVLFRSERAAGDSLVGIQYITSGREAMIKVARQCVRSLYSDFFEAVQGELASRPDPGAEVVAEAGADGEAQVAATPVSGN